MKNIRRPATGLLFLILIVLIPTIGATGGAANGGQARLARAPKMMPGVTMTSTQLQKYRKSRTRAARVSTTSVLQTAPLLPPRLTDSRSTGFVAFAIGDITGDARADVVALGVRPRPDQSMGRIAVYPLPASGIPGVPIYSNVNSVLATGPGGVVLTPVLGARPDLVVWGSFWIEIFTIAADGTAGATPVTIATGLAIRNVVVANLDGDGRPDLIVSGNDANDPSLPMVIRRYLQGPGGVFTASGTDARFSGGDGVLADLDGDGIIDELDGVSGSTTFGFTYRLGLADGTFAAPVNVMETSSAYTGVRLSVSDVDGDGLADVVLATGDGARVRFQTSPGTFSTTVIPNSGSSGNISHLSVGDLDGNGLRDAVMWTDGYNVMQVAMQTSPRVFSAAGLYEVPFDGYPAFYDRNTAIADLNGDAKADVLVLSSGVIAYYNSGGSYPVLDASVTSTTQVDDAGPIAHIEWQHRVSNAGPTALVDGFLLQDLPLQYELTGASVSCAYFATLVVCPVTSLPAGGSTTITIQAKSVATRPTDANIPSLVSVFNDGPEIDVVPGNDSATVSTPVRGHLEEMQAAADEVFVYESAGETIIPVIAATGSSSMARCGGWYLNGPNPADGGIVGATNGTTCLTPAQKGPARGLVGLRDGSTANGLLQYSLAVSTVDYNAATARTFSIVDDDGSDPRLMSSGAQPFEASPPLFSSAQTLHTPQGLELPKSAAIGDVDHDGRMDLAVSFGGSSGAWISVWLQQPDGTLSATPLNWTAAHGVATFAIADVTGDAAAEIIVPQQGELDLVRLVNGQLQTVDSVAMDCARVAVADLDLDGFSDIVVADSREQSPDGPQYWLPNVSVFRGNAQRTLDANPYRFAMPYSALRSQLVIGKFDADARPDIAITNGGVVAFPSASIAYQKPDGTFAEPVAVWVSGPDYVDGLAFSSNVTTGDFNGDGRTDLAVSSFVGPYLPSVWIFEDLRHDDFSRPTQRLYTGDATSLATLDMDHDGRDDLLVDNSIGDSGPRTPVQVFLQDMSGTLAHAGSLSKFGSGLIDPWIQKMATGDFDGDGATDAVILDSMDGYVHVVHSSAANQAVQIGVLESSSSAVVGTRTRYRLRITNTGARRSLEIPLSWPLPQVLATPQIVAAKGACYVSASTAQCLLPQLDAGGYVDVMLTGSFSAAGSYSMAIAAGPGGGYGSGTISTTVTAASSGGGSSGGGSSGGGSSGGGGSLEWLSLAVILSCVWRRALRRPSHPSMAAVDRRRL